MKSRVAGLFHQLPLLVYARELQKYDETLEMLKHTYDEQNQLLQDLSRANDRFTTSRAGAT